MNIRNPIVGIATALFSFGALAQTPIVIKFSYVGAVQMPAPSISKFGPLGVKEFEIFDLPFITPDIASFDRVANSPLGAAEEDAQKSILATGRTMIYEPTPAEQAELRKAVLPVHREMETRLGKEAIQAMYQASGFSAER